LRFFRISISYRSGDIFNLIFLMFRKKATFCGSEKVGFREKKNRIKKRLIQSIDCLTWNPQKGFSFYNYFWIFLTFPGTAHFWGCWRSPDKTLLRQWHDVSSTGCERTSKKLRDDFDNQCETTSTIT
jgi:hypothetical protein